MDENGLAAGVVYHDWDQKAGVIEISAASRHRGWSTPDAIRAVFSYPFDELGCQMIVTRTADDNRRVHRIWGALGADRIDVPRLFGRDRGGVIFTLTDEAWRSGKFARDHGKVEITEAA